MKKLLAVTLILAMALSGCAAIPYIMNGMTVVEEKICPTMEMAKQALMAAGFLQAYPQFAGAFAIFDLLSKGICVANSQLLAAIKDYNTIPVPSAGVKMGMIKPSIDSLVAAVK